MNKDKEKYPTLQEISEDLKKSAEELLNDNDNSKANYNPLIDADYSPLKGYVHYGPNHNEILVEKYNKRFQDEQDKQKRNERLLNYAYLLSNLINNRDDNTISYDGLYSYLGDISQKNNYQDSEKIYFDLVDQIAEKRRSLKITQNTMAKICKCTKLYINKIEKHEYYCSSLILIRAAKALGINIIFDDREESTDTNNINPELLNIINNLDEEKQNKLINIIKTIF